MDNLNLLLTEDEEQAVMDRLNLLLWCRAKCNNELLEDVGGLSMVLDRLEGMIHNAGISSESIGGLSQSFSADMNSEMLKLLSPYRKAKFI